ncbi:MAG: hypothetical protein KatS3mg081_1266 [Gemmatimonadales bacterium]|nr:MAG: hypothetical protein KatS3mg081_1266 [Gemmatimonadales bacterium]
MNGSKLLLPIRVPELGPHLGKLVTGTGNQQPGGLALDEIRIDLATRIMELAGEARQLAGRDERWPVFEAVGREAWLSAWDRAVEGVSTLMLDKIRAEIEMRAAAAKMPRRLLKRFLPGEAEKRVLKARLASAGAVLVPVLDRMAELAREAAMATPAERGLLEDWQETLKAGARKLEAAWLALEEEVEAEARRLDQAAEFVAQWRRPLWPVVLAGSVGLGLAVWVGLVLGGYLPFPDWLRDLWIRLPLAR